MPLPIQMRKSARKYFDHLDQPTQQRIRRKLSSIADDPFDVLHSKPLIGTERRSARVGGYRILFLVMETLILVTEIDARLRQVRLAGRPPLTYDVLSLGLGSMPATFPIPEALHS